MNPLPSAAQYFHYNTLKVFSALAHTTSPVTQAASFPSYGHLTLWPGSPVQVPKLRGRIAKPIPLELPGVAQTAGHGSHESIQFPAPPSETNCWQK